MNDQHLSHHLIPPAPASPGGTLHRSAPGVTHDATLGGASARRQLRRVAAVTLVGVLAHALTWQSDGLGINAVLVVGAYLALALGHNYGWRPGRAWGRLGLPVRVQLAVWCALAVATVWHLDPWTSVTFVLSSLTVATAVVAGPRLDPVSLFARGLLRVATGPLAAAHFAYRTCIALDNRLRGSQRTAVRALVPALGIGVVAALYSLSNSWIAGMWTGFGEWLAELSARGDLGWHFVLVAAWSAGGVGLFYRMGYVEPVFTWGFWGLAAKPAPQRTLSTTTGPGLATSPATGPELATSTGSGPELATSGATGSAPALAGPATTHDASDAAWSLASATLVGVNALAVGLNLTDAFTTWFGARATAAAELTHGVHQGTWALSLAVVLATAALCYLEAFPPADRQRARTLGLAWLGQNVMMVLTVALRNYHYTDAFGMTYRRLGVYLFLACTLVGLYLLTRTVLEHSSVAGLVRRQAWATYFVLALAALVDWPGAFTRYNLRPERHQPDRAYLAQLLPHNLPTWYALDPEHVTSLLDRTAPHAWWIKDSQPVADWREWDLAQARRVAVLKHALANPAATTPPAR